MARQVTGTAGSFLNVSTGEAIPYPFSYSLRIKYLLPAGGGVSLAYGEAYPQWDGEYLTSAVQTQNVGYGKGSTFGSAVYTHPTAFPAGWHLVVGVNVSATERRVYVDGGSQTAIDTTAAPFVGHASKNLTLGGILVGANSLHTPAGFDGQVADVAIWNTALTPADADALMTSRPGSVKAGNLKAWYKLGADGDLSSSAGSYPAMTVFGSVPVSADPPYPSAFERNSLIYSAEKFQGIATDAAAPYRQDLCLWVPMTPPFTDGAQAWNARTGHAPLVLGGAPKLGEDGSFRIDSSGGQFVSTDMGYVNPYSNGQVISCWLKIFSFPQTASLLSPTMFFQSIQEGGGYWQSAGFINDGGIPYGLQYRLTYSRMNVYAWHGGIESPTQVPRDQWFHAVISCDMNPIHAQGGYAHYYFDGKYQGAGVGTLRSDIGRTSTTAYIGEGNIFGTIGDYEIKDFRIYTRFFNAEEVRDLYEHSKAFHEATSGLINSTIRPVRLEPQLLLIARAAAHAVAKGIAFVPGAVSRAMARAQVPAYARGVTHTPGAFTKAVARAHKPAQAKGVKPQGGAITRLIARAQGAAHAKGVYFWLPPVLTSWARAQAPAFVRGVTSTPGLAVALLARARGLARAKGLLPQGGLVSQTLARVDGLARTFGVTFLFRDFSFHGALTRMFATSPTASIERERRALFGWGSRLELMTISGHEWVPVVELTSHWVARRARLLGTSDEWLLEIPEDTMGGYEGVKDLAGAKIYTHGQILTFRITQMNRPLKAGHVWEFTLEAIGDRQ